jgi:3-hydroxyisobutyrate dehydrogenase-like beta-hydroxyacid dehydrogenase
MAGTVGFIGLGNMGGPMALNLVKAGFELIVHDINPARVAPLIAAGATLAASAEAVAANCHRTICMVETTDQAESVILGDSGIIQSAKQGDIVLCMSTIDPLAARRFAERLADKGVAMLDAPVSGGMEGAQTRDLLVMAGGDPGVFERARPLLDAIAKRVMYTGGIGTGSIAKIMHNSATFTLDLVMAECWTVGVKAGIDAATIVKVFNEAALGHQMNLKVRLPATYLRGDFDPRFSLALARKDLGLALELARETDTPMRLAAICEEEMIEAISRGWADRDASIFLTLQEERAHIQVRLPPS